MGDPSAPAGRRPPVGLAHIVSHPIQYFAPLYRELATRPEVDLTVFFCSDFTVREFEDPGFGRAIAWDTPLLEGYRHRFLPSAEGRVLSGGPVLYRPSLDVIRAVNSGPYQAVWVHGYAHLNAWLAALSTRMKRRAYLARDEPTLQHSRPGWRRALKYPVLRAQLAGAAGLYIGEENRRYLRHYGVPEQRLFPTRYCVDNDFFRQSERALAPQRDEIRRSFGISTEDPVVLFCGKFVPKKQPLAVIEAFARVRRQRRCWLLMVGDGELRPAAEALVRETGVPDVLFSGFLNQSEIPRAYAAADLFALFSGDRETWGLVVNEAMNFSLPMVVSDKVGCGADLVEADRNGYVVAHDDVSELAAALERLVESPERCRRFGEHSRELVSRYNIEACADGIVAACLTMTGRR